MRNKVKQAILLCFCLSASIVSWAQDTSWYSDSETTFTLTTKEQFLGFKELVNSGNTFEGKTVKLETDIVLNDFSTVSLDSENLQEWTRIGYEYNRPFMGIFDGGGHTIFGLYINKPQGDRFGLFGYVENGTIRNLCLKNSYVCGNSYVGGIVGYCKGGTIENCSNKGRVIIKCHPGGGICGYITGGSISNCCNYGDITSNHNYAEAGGIVGNSNNSDIYNNANYSSISSTGNSPALSGTGGIVGRFFYSGNKKYIANCFNKGDINGKTNCGGISSDGKPYNCINYGHVNAKDSYLGPIVSGYSSSNTVDCFYLDTSCSNSNSGISKTEEQLKSPDFLSLINFNCEEYTNTLGLQLDAWKFDKEGYPILDYINVDEAEYIEVQNIILSKNIISIKPNESQTLEKTIFPFFSKHNLKWVSADERVAKVDQNGVVTGVGPGETVITLTDKLTNVQTTCDVSVNISVGDTFKGDIPSGEGIISTTFMLKDKENRLVSIGDGNNAAIEITTMGNITIPPTFVGSDNKTYTINSINNRAFYATNISSVTIPQEIMAIGDNAFSGCSSLTSVTVESTEPLAINSTCFSIKFGATLYVPKGCYEVYKAADVWKDFGKIIEPDHNNGETFVASITAGSGKTNARFQVIDADKKYVSLGNGEEASIADDASGKVIVPSTVTGYDGKTYNVKQLSAGAFFGCYGITSVELASSITIIGQAAFYDCPALTSINIPTNVTSIGEDAFNGCSNLASINIPANVTSIGDGAFYGCSKLTSVTVNWATPIAIDNECFTNAANATLNVPKGSYESYANADNWKNFKTIKEPAHVVGDTFVGYVMVDGVKTNARYKVTNATSKYVNIGNGEECAISDFTTGNVVVPSSVTGYDGQAYQVKQVAPAAFFGCTEVTSIGVPSGITTFGQAAFYQCSGITSFDIPTTVTTIGEGAFSYCENLQEILIPKNVSSIGTDAFAECGNLTSVTVEWTTPITINNDCFSNAANATLFVPCETKELYGSANGWKMFKEIVEVYNDGDVFKELTDGGVEMTFKVISAADKTCQVGTGNDSERAINKKTAGAITIPEIVNNLTVTGIASYAFKECTSLTSVIIPKSVTELGEQSFIFCQNLTSIDIPNTVTNIGANALRYCYALKSITIPSSVISIGLAAFGSNKDLESIVVESGNTIYDSRDNCNAIICTATNELISGCKETIIPNSVTSIGRSAFNGCYNLSGITIPSSITTIGQYAFYDCSGLTDICIPNSVTSIGQYAFNNCGNLTSVTVDWNEPISISTNCFSNAANATLYVPLGTNKYYKAATGWKDFGIIANSTESSIFAGEIVVCRGGRVVLPIHLNNVEDVQQLDFELSLPEGVSVVTDDEGYPIASLTSRASSTHIITGSKQSNGNFQFQILLKTVSDNVIQGHDGRIANIPLKVLLKTAPGDYDIKLTAGVLSVKDESQGTYLGDTHSKMTVSKILLGDTNDDEKINVVDISNIINYILGKNIPDFVWYAANASGDERISVTDISTIIDIILGKTVFGEKQAKKLDDLE